MSNKKILVLGSKYGSKLPDISVDKIYTANAAALRAIKYREKYPNTELICCTNGKEFERNLIVEEAILKSMPNKIIFRRNKSKTLSINNCEIKILNNKEQINFQSNFFNLKKISFYLGELKYRKKNIKDTLSYFYNNFKRNSFLGVSTGLFAILTALHENDGCEIITSGITFDGGPKFYKSLREVDQNHIARAIVDAYLIKNVKKIYLNKIITLDTNMAMVANIKIWKGLNIS